MFRIRYFYRGDDCFFIMSFINRDNALNAYGAIIDDERIAGVSFFYPGDKIASFAWIE